MLARHSFPRVAHGAVDGFVVSNNVDEGVTGGVFQYDVIGNADATEMATHGNVAASEPNLLQTLHFMDTFYEGGPAEIIDPYRELAIK